ncbi:MAG: hypothetical protein HKO57_14940, partial [Akkermansiaceae bacterium]|nr:hypothetical protein [Akkermansiaceae bacterium]
AEGFARIREAAEDVQHRIVVQDLSWTRSNHFRLAVAALFDDLVAQRAIPEIEEVRIVAQPGHRTAALLMLAWLATQAQWRPGLELGLAAERAEGCDECHLFESRGGKSVTARIDWDAEGAPLGLLEIGAPDLMLRISREPGDTHLVHRLERAGHVLEQCGPADPDESAELVGSQLSRGGRNSLFRKVWPAFFDLLGAG